METPRQDSSVRTTTHIRKDGRRVIRSHRTRAERDATLAKYVGKRAWELIATVEWP